jgi:formylglycine-generating enzyme required for sulfatase activity
MSGTVWEAVNDWYDSGYYGNAPSENLTGQETGTYRVLRGGAWSNSVQNGRTADRFNNTPASVFDYIGFQCVQE